MISWLELFAAQDGSDMWLWRQTYLRSTIRFVVKKSKFQAQKRKNLLFEWNWFEKRRSLLRSFEQTATIAHY